MSQNKCKKFCSQKCGADTHSQLQIRGVLVYVQRQIICKIQTRETCSFVKVLLCFFCALSQYCFQILPGTSHLLIHPFKSPDQIKRKAYIDFATKKNLQRINSEHEQPKWRRHQKGLRKFEYAVFQTSSRWLKVTQFFKYRGFFQDLKGVEFVRPRPRVFTSAVKHHVSRFHFAVVQ